MNVSRLIADHKRMPRRPGRARRHPDNGGQPASSRQRILDYLADQGGSVESPDGRGLTREMARAVGYDDLSTLNAMLTRLEREGAIVRDVRGRRTYRIAVAPSGPNGRRRRGRSGGGTAESTESQTEAELRHPRGQLRLCLLLLLAERPGHGYDLVERLRPFGYERDDPAQTYRALHWLESAGLVDPTWETVGPGPARRVFTLTPEGRRMLQRCAATVRERTRMLEAQLERLPSPRLEVVPTPEHSFEVLVEAKLSVSAEDEESARRKVEAAFAELRPVDADVRATGQVWLYEANPEDADS